MKIHLKTAFDSIRRSPFQAASAISVLIITFFIATLISILVYASNQLLIYFETRPQVIAFLKNEATVEAISALQRKLNSDSRIKEVRYVSKEEALEIYKSATADNPLLAELVSPSIFPASLEFSVTDLKFTNEVIGEIKNEGVVDSVGFTASIGGEESLGNVVERLKTITFYVRLGGGILALILGIASFLVLLVVIGMRIATRRKEIETLDLIGATAGFIRSPIILEALIYAAFGVFIGWLVGLILLLYITPSVLTYFGAIPILPKDTKTFFLLMGAILLGELLIGALIAISGSLMAISRARRDK